LSGDVVCAGIKKADSTDLQVETLSRTLFSAWKAFGFDWLIGFDTSLQSAGVLQDQASPGTGDEISKTGTSVVSDPPGWLWAAAPPESWTHPSINFIEGAGITIDAAENTGLDATDVTIAAAGVTPGGVGALYWTGAGPAAVWSNVLKFKTDANGKLEWGSGSALDANLYRASAYTLKTDGAFIAAADVSAGSNIVARLGGATEVQFGYVGSGTPGIYLGNLLDTVLYRAGANLLKTGGDFHAALDIAAAVGAAGQTLMGGRGPAGQAGFQLGSLGDTTLYRSGAGVLALTMGALGVRDLVYGAADSAGSGYRTVRVAN
jgi:hypothetical protein